MNHAQQPASSPAVQAIFNAITSRYDFLNSLLSAGIDRAWRRRMVGAMRFFKTHRYLDLAAGTGDISLRCAKQYPGVTVLATDFAAAMLDCARDKIRHSAAADRITVAFGDATNLDLADNSFDTTGMAFGIRNIADKLGALKEMRRVTTAGGRVLILELTLPRQPIVRWFYRLYLCEVMPRIAGLFTPQPDAYHYLADSIVNFPETPAFLALMREAGIVSVSAHPLTLGTCHLFSGTVEG